MKRSTKLTKDQKQEIHTFIRNGARSGREVRRAQAVLLVDEDVDIAAIHTVTGYKRRQIFTVRSKYLNDGIETIKDKQKGTPKELLTKQQRREIIETIKTKKPKELDAYYQNYAYWTTGVLGAYIEHTHKVKYKSKTSHYLLFKEAKFTYHKPGRVSQRRNEEEIQEWQQSVTPKVKTAWHDPDTVILTEDEMHLSNQTTVQKIWLPKGEYPKIEIVRKRDARSIYGFLNVKTGQEHAFKTKWQNMYITAEILLKIRALYPQKKILLFWDQAGWHKGSEAQKIIKEDGNIETLYFPTATPEENPQEHVWKSGRSQCIHNRFIEDMDATTDTFVTYLNTTKFPYSLLGFSARS